MKNMRAILAVVIIIIGTKLVLSLPAHPKHAQRKHEIHFHRKAETGQNHHHHRNSSTSKRVHKSKFRSDIADSTDAILNKTLTTQADLADLYKSEEASREEEEKAKESAEAKKIENQKTIEPTAIPSSEVAAETPGEPLALASPAALSAPSVTNGAISEPEEASKPAERTDNNARTVVGEANNQKGSQTAEAVTENLVPLLDSGKVKTPDEAQQEVLASAKAAQLEAVTPDGKPIKLELCNEYVEKPDECKGENSTVSNEGANQLETSNKNTANNEQRSPYEITNTDQDYKPITEPALAKVDNSPTVRQESYGKADALPTVKQESYAKSNNSPTLKQEAPNNSPVGQTNTQTVEQVPDKGLQQISGQAIENTSGNVPETAPEQSTKEQNMIHMETEPETISLPAASNATTASTADKEFTAYAQQGNSEIKQVMDPTKIENTESQSSLSEHSNNNEKIISTSSSEHNNLPQDSHTMDSQKRKLHESNNGTRKKKIYKKKARKGQKNI